MSLPELFAVKTRPKAASSVVAVAAPPLSADAVPPEALVPFVPDDAPLKAAVPAGDLRPLFRSRAEFFAPFLGVSFNRVSVKDQRSLWGSCSQQGNLNFSWRIALAPDPVLDYLVVHELAHRAQMNHSRAFWTLVERLCPAHRTHRRWLRKNGRALHDAVRPS